MIVDENDLLEDQRKVDSFLCCFVKIDRQQQNLQVYRTIHILERTLPKFVEAVALLTRLHDLVLHLHPSLNLSYYFCKFLL